MVFFHLMDHHTIKISPKYANFYKYDHLIIYIFQSFMINTTLNPNLILIMY